MYPFQCWNYSNESLRQLFCALYLLHIHENFYIHTICILRRRTDTGAFAGGHSAALADIDFFCLSGYFSFNNDIVVLRYPFKHGVG